MPIQDILPVKITSAVWRAIKRIPPIYKVSPSESDIEESLKKSDFLKEVATNALYDDEILEILVELEKARHLVTARRAGLTMRAQVVGVDRLRNEPLTDEGDRWLRERCFFWIFVQESSGTLPQIRKAIAWYIGLIRRDAEWRNNVLPQVGISSGSVPYWPYQSVSGIGTDLTRFIRVSVPWSLIDTWVGDSYTLGDSSGDFPWQFIDEGKVVHGHHLALDLLDLSEALSRHAVKVQIWGTGWGIGSPDGSFPWQSMNEADGMISGPLELLGAEGVRDYETDPSGNLALTETDAVPNIVKQSPPNQIFGEHAGKRIFRYGIGATGGGFVLWP